VNGIELNNKQHYKLISSKHRFLELNLKELWEYRDLILIFTKRNFTVRYKQTILGPAWLLINPVISSLIYCFIFGGIAGISTEGVPRLLFYLSGNAIWAFFSESLSKNANTFIANEGIFGKVYFPRLAIPIANVITSMVEYGIKFSLILIFMIYYMTKGMVHPHFESWILILFVLVELGTMGMGIGVIISSITTKYRDLAILVGFATQLWMYLTPVVYPLSQAGNGALRTILLINPVTAPVEVYRYALLGKGEIIPIDLIWSIIFTLMVAALGSMIFNKVEKTFMDTV
jgi:lipopolysaccharide transport system permease protein